MKDEREGLARRFTEDAQVDDLVHQAVRHALDHRRRLGLEIVVWEEGRIVHIPPEQIVTEDHNKNEQ
jgi:hypothetical protein